MTASAVKPTGAKAYGSIPHIPGSRMGPGDHHCHEGQARIATTEFRDRHDSLTVTVKLDGSCVSVARLSDGNIVALGRAGYPAATSPHSQHQMFAAWVQENEYRFLECLEPGERFVGEWLAQAHGTRYQLFHEPFVIFDLMVGARRLPNAEMLFRSESGGFATPATIHTGSPLNLPDAIRKIETPMHGELEPVEGAVWRIERKGEFDFICKWVRHDKVDGKYLPEISGGQPVWNWAPKGGKA